MTKEYITKFFQGLSHASKGFEGWLHKTGHDKVFERLAKIDREPLTKVQLNQLLLLSLEAGISDDFFRYYWLSTPSHSYSVDKVDDFDTAFSKASSIISLQHLRWGLRRIYIDGLLYFGSVKHGFRELKNMTMNQLTNFFRSKSIPTDTIKERGRSLEFNDIAKDERYLISEMACKTYGETPKTEAEFKDFLIESYREAVAQGKRRISFRDLILRDKDDNGTLKDNFDYINKKSREKYAKSLPLFEFSADEILESNIDSQETLIEKYIPISDKFLKARESALKNTSLYLSLVNDLDVYVATSMRTRKDFREMADSCDSIFKNPKLKDLHLRYFDPTISAAEGHEDKGLIECLMVKCAKVLVYCAGDRDSYGKDAEAAMALSLGKHVIFYCSAQTKADFFRSVHPLSRLIDFSTGVAVGTIVAENPEEVSELLSRIFENRMEYTIEQTKPGYFKLKERMTNSVVRVQTNFKLLSKSFWTYYHSRHEVS
jgi:hypothetical protein